jgi:hypothetical protein
MIEGDLTMNKIRFTLKAFAFVVFALACASAAQAQATRTWVSGVGDDVNPCSRTAPCKTFAGAISKTADGGEIDCLDPGGFGTITITKSITIDGTTGAGFGSILAAGTTGVNANDSASGAPMTKIIRLRNLSINGATTGINGISYTSAKAVYVENCSIFGFKGGAGTTQGNGIRASLTADGGLLFVRDTIITENRTDGVQTTTSAGAIRVICDGVRADRNTVGFHAVNASSFHVVNSSASSNANGAQFENATSANLEHVTLQANTGAGLRAGGGAPTVRISDCGIINNLTVGVDIAGGTVFTFGDNKIRGNGATGINDVAGGSLNGTTTKQ